MKTVISTYLILLFAGGFTTYAQDVVSSPGTDGINTPPAVEKATVPEKTRPGMKNNIFYGGYINLSFGNYSVIGIEPMVGYRLTPKLSSGVKVRYDYIRDSRYAETRTTSTYGGSFFARYLVTPKFYAQVEPASYNYEFFYIGGGSEREWVPFLFAGGGVVQPLSERTWLNVEILFDVLRDEKSPYDDWQPFFSIGVGAGF